MKLSITALSVFGIAMLALIHNSEAISCYSCANCQPPEDPTEDCASGYDFCVRDEILFEHDSQVHRYCAEECVEVSNSFFDRKCCDDADLCNGASTIAISSVFLGLAAAAVRIL